MEVAREATSSKKRDRSGLRSRNRPPRAARDHSCRFAWTPGAKGARCSTWTTRAIGVASGSTCPGDQKIRGPAADAKTGSGTGRWGVEIDALANDTTPWRGGGEREGHDDIAAAIDRMLFRKAGRPSASPTLDRGRRLAEFLGGRTLLACGADRREGGWAGPFLPSCHRYKK